MGPAGYSWNHQNNVVSSLDLLEEEVLREASKHGPRWKRDKHLLGGTCRYISQGLVRSHDNFPTKASTSVQDNTPAKVTHYTNNAEEEEESKKQLQLSLPNIHCQLENERLQREISQWQREVKHARVEKLELEASFRRLDQEIGNGYNLAERKEKELRIAELVTKNQKRNSELRLRYTELEGEHKKLTDKVTLLNQVLNSLEIKYAELSTSHSSLTTSYEAAHHRIDALQRDNLVLQGKLSTSDTHGVGAKCEYKSNKFKQTQKIASATQIEAQRALDRQGELEQELQAVHNQKIQINAALRTMEAKLCKLAVLKNRMMKASPPDLPVGDRVAASEPSEFRTDDLNDNAMVSRMAKLTSTITSLTEKLRITEETQNHKSRSLDILMQAFPLLLRCLDATRDQLAAVVESNDIIKNALEQIHNPYLLNSSNANEGPVSGPMYLRLARHKYLLEAPYPIDLLADQTAAQALSGNQESAMILTRAKLKRFPPFRITYSVLERRDNQFEDEDEDQMKLVLLSTDSNDTSGASYLNRSKINAFLEVIQSNAARKKFKTLVIGKLAEYMSKLRELAHRSASEAAMHQASVQMLQREVVDLQMHLKSDESKYFVERGKNHKTRQFLIKMIAVCTEKQHENDHRQMTDMLITDVENGTNGSFDDQLCLSNCELDDDDVAQLLLKIHVSEVRFREINISSNNLSDVGAQYVADFLEKAPPSVRVVNLNDNKRISRCGIELIKQGLLRNQRVQRVKEDQECEDGIILRGLAIQQEFEVTAEGTDILCVVLPFASEYDGITVDLKTTTPEAVGAMVKKLRQLGFRYNIRPTSASSRLRPTSYSNKNQRTDLCLPAEKHPFLVVWELLLGGNLFQALSPTLSSLDVNG
ncbi:hypothetical protein P3T76_007423 [Phytophthora citrophthora]|uniref:Uncharacterized protein n=1 Tax=Phytophthora citrophthora TaxID=4793 RepID=A0AAD9LN90_9STRA|nr:hypothetical protein P3T76_007423 [Phytophthora citrophthora]